MGKWVVVSLVVLGASGSVYSGVIDLVSYRKCLMSLQKNASAQRPLSGLRVLEDDEYPELFWVTPLKGGCEVEVLSDQGVSSYRIPAEIVGNVDLGGVVVQVDSDRRRVREKDLSICGGGVASVNVIPARRTRSLTRASTQKFQALLEKWYDAFGNRQKPGSSKVREVRTACRRALNLTATIDHPETPRANDRGSSGSDSSEPVNRGAGTE